MWLKKIYFPTARYLGFLLFVLFFSCDKKVCCSQEKSTDLDEGLVAYWAMDEGTGTQVSSTGMLNVSGTLTGASWGEGHQNKAVVLNTTSNGYIDLGKKLYGTLNGAGQITLSCWIKNVDHPDLRYDIFNTFNNAGGGFGVYLAPKGELRIGGRSVADEPFRSNGFNYTFTGIWVHLVAMIDYAGNEFVLYVNGKKIPVKTGAKPTFSANKYTVTTQAVNDYIGGFKGRNYTFNGSIDEVRIYNRKLNSDEIFALARPDLNPNLVSPQDVERKKVQSMRSLMQNHVAFYEGKNHAISGSKRYFIDGENPLVAPFSENNISYVPVAFVAKKLGANVAWDSSAGEMIIAKGNRQVRLKKGDSFIAVDGQNVNIEHALMEKNNALFASKEDIGTILNEHTHIALSGKLVIIGSETNRFQESAVQEVLALMPDYFLPDKFPAPKRDVRSSRQELLYLDPKNKRYVANPSIEKLPDGTYIASCTDSGAGLRTFIYQSKDKAQSWELLTALSGIMWGTLFHHNGSLYIMGTNNSLGDIVIRKSDDGGKTWTEAKDSKTGVLVKGGSGYSTPPNHHTAPTAVIKANGRIYRAYEDNDPHEFPKMKAFLVSAPADSDLLNADNWTATKKTSYDYNNWKAPFNFLSPGWLEGNAVLAPDGNIWNFIRFNSMPHRDKAAVMRLSSDKSELLFNYPQDIIDFPGGNTKFSIKYDETTKKYYALSNNSVDPTFADHRCVLSLVVSDDLLNWKVVETVLYDDNLHFWEDSMLLVGYQYVDFIFDGNDIVFVVREAWGDNANYHDANRFTSYVLKNYAKYVN